MLSPKILHYNNVDNCQGYSFLPFSTFGSPDTDARLLAETAYFDAAMQYNSPPGAHLSGRNGAPSHFVAREGGSSIRRPDKEPTSVGSTGELLEPVTRIIEIK